ncbi:MAG: hypothetical protein QOH41_1348 [Blastocatellia bacterium]|jgi:hypothetical protein|nr:hypothetical protein [Blastocatellia bacterium]
MWIPSGKKSRKQRSEIRGRKSEKTSEVTADSNQLCQGFECIQSGVRPRYEAHFISTLTDCDGENSETDSSLDFARDCSYITREEHSDLTVLSQEVGRMLGSMIKNPCSFLTHH